MSITLSEAELLTMVDEIWAVYDEKGNGYLNCEEFQRMIHDICRLFGQKVDVDIMSVLVTGIGKEVGRISKIELAIFFQCEGNNFF